MVVARRTRGWNFNSIAKLKLLFKKYIAFHYKFCTNYKEYRDILTVNHLNPAQI